MKFNIKKSPSNRGFWQSNRGFSMVQVLVAAAVASIVLAAIAQAVIDSQKQNAAAFEKVALAALQRDLVAYASFDMCAKEFASNIPAFSYAGGVFPTAGIDLTHLYASATSANALYEVTQKLGSKDLKISSIKILNLQLVSAAAGKYIGELEIKTDSGLKLYEPIKNTILVTTTTVGGTVTLTGCAGMSARANLANITCGSGYYLEGFDGNGDKICISVTDGSILPP